MKSIFIFALTVVTVTGCTSLGNPTSKSPKQLEAERQFRQAEAATSVSPRVLRAADRTQVEGAAETLVILQDGQLP